MEKVRTEKSKIKKKNSKIQKEKKKAYNSFCI